MSRAWFFALCTLALGQMLAASFGFARVQAVFSAAVLSPAPKVFTAVDGLEPFSSRYRIVLHTTHTAPLTFELDTRTAARLVGPYNRRNVYGAVVAFAPVLAQNARTRPMFEAVVRHALCADAPLLGELGLSLAAPASTIVIEQLPRARTQTLLPLRVEVSC
jgi:hypothetical protein